MTTQVMPRLFGRTIELNELNRLLVHAAEGTGSALVVRGEPGVGKSALLDRFVAGAAGCRIARATGVESEMKFGFAGLHQLCGPFLNLLDRLPVPQRDALGAAFGLRAARPPDRFLTGMAALSLFAELAETQPLICLLDDAQWLDRATIQVLGFVARRLAGEAIGIVFATRELKRVDHLAGLAELSVGPLGDADARGVLASAMPGPLDERVRDRIVAEARGNPAALLQLARGWTPAACAGGFGLPDSVAVPDGIEDALRGRIRSLPDNSRRLLLVAAADPLGDPAVMWAAAERLGIATEATVPATDLGLLELGTPIRFDHPLVRSVVYRAAAVGERRLVHTALAEVTDASTDPDRRAWHLAAAAAGPDEEIALELEKSVGHAQARGGLAAAAAFLQGAAVLGVDQERRSERALVAAQACLAGGSFDAVAAMLALAETGPLDEFQRGRADLLRGHVAAVSGLSTDAAQLLLNAGKRLEALDEDLARETYLLACAAATRAGVAGTDLRSVIAGAIQTLPSSPAPRPHDLVLDGMAQAVTNGHIAGASIQKHADMAVTDIPVEAIVRWGALAIAPSGLVWNVEATIATLERYAQVARNAGALAVLPGILDNLGLAKACLGDFTGAAAVVDEADRVAAATGMRFLQLGRLWLRALQGRPADVAAFMASAIDPAADAGRADVVASAHVAAAVMYNALARYPDAVSAGRVAAVNHIDPWASPSALPELIEAAARSGEIELASDALERLTATTRPARNDLALGIEARCRALVSNGSTADMCYREAIERLSRTQVRPDLGRAHLLYGEWLRREGRRLDARKHLRIAYNTFEAIGMEDFAERTRRELVATGETVKKRSVPALDELTPQEAQIARLAGDGRTNPEIAAELFLSPRTVEWHLRKVFAKLGVSSRRHLGTALPRPSPTAAASSKVAAANTEHSRFAALDSRVTSGSSRASNGRGKQAAGTRGPVRPDEIWSAQSLIGASGDELHGTRRQPGNGLGPAATRAVRDG